ncbi:helix-turn-helix transcriptional regulator [Yinghuangia sp. YIM S09857]|uniref:helix-turn-helix transcriptional regulator n=1 Tax=Yinghuangia sp. YIM S09857 TaxID=3436929 RepID=UPI003F52AD21
MAVNAGRCSEPATAAIVRGFLRFRPRGLPRPATSFIGRGRELRDVLLAVESRRLVTLTGVGGIGKTRLALRAAEDWSRRAAWSVVFVSLVSLEDPRLVETAVCEAAGIGTDLAVSPLRVAQQVLDDKPVLLVLDNCEHLVDEAARVAGALLASCPNVRILATSRQSLGLPGELLWSVPSLAMRSVEDEPGPSDAAMLFAARVPPGFGDSRVAPEFVEQLVAELEGIPLAIELAACGRGDDGHHMYELLAAFRSADPGPAREGRHSTMRRSLEWSRALLDDVELLVFRRLSVFADGWTLDAAQFVCADAAVQAAAATHTAVDVVDAPDTPTPAEATDSGYHPAHPIDREDVLEALLSLRDKSLVESVSTDSDRRFRMLVPVRQFAAGLAAESGDDTLASDRHRAYYVSFARTAERERWALDPALRERLDTEAPNLRAALDAACRIGSEDALRLTTALSLYWRVGGHQLEGSDALERALRATEATTDSTNPVRGRAIAQHAWLSFWHGRLPEALDDIQESLRLARTHGHPHDEAFALTALATARQMLDPCAAQTQLQQAVALAVHCGDQVALADALSSLAISYHWQDNYPRMAAAARIGDAVASAVGHRSALFWNRWGRAHQARVAGDVATAAAIAEGFDAWTVTGNPLLRSAATEVTVLLAVMTGDAEGGLIRARAELAASTDESVRWGMSPVRHALGFAELAAGNLDAAHAVGVHLFDLERDGTGYLAWHAQEILMHAALASGRSDDARQHAAAIRAIARKLGNRRAEIVARIGEAEAAQLSDDTAHAEADAHDVLRVCAEHGWWIDALASLDVLVGVAAARGLHERATRLAAGVREARRVRGLVRVPPLSASARALIDRAAAALPRDQREKAVEVGTQMPLKELADYVSRGRGKRGTDAGQSGLTRMELRVATLAASGLNNKAIAEELFIAPGTVKNHLSHVFAKLSVSNRTQLASAFDKV